MLNVEDKYGHSNHNEIVKMGRSDEKFVEIN